MVWYVFYHARDGGHRTVVEKRRLSEVTRISHLASHLPRLVRPFPSLLSD